MKLSLFCAVLTVIEAGVVTPCADTLTIQKVVYEKEVLIENPGVFYILTIDHNTNTLFFKNVINNTEQYLYLNLKDKSTGTIGITAKITAFVVDHHKQIVYIGTVDGIYTFDYDTKKAVNLQITDKDIWNMFYKDGLYFTTFPDGKVYVYKDDQVKLVPEFTNIKASAVVINNENHFVYAYLGKLLLKKNGNNIWLGYYGYIFGLIQESHGDLYFSTDNGIYRIEDEEIVKVVSIEHCIGFAIQADDTIIYSDVDRVIQLKPTNRLC